MAKGTGEADGRQAEFVFALAALLMALLLLSQAGEQVRWIAERPLTRQPGLVSVAALVAMVVFGAFALAFSLKRRGADGTPIGAELRHWLTALEYPFWFLAYVLAVPWIGYLLATIAFCLLLTYRIGYRSQRALAASAGVGVATVIVFKSLLSVKIPGGALYDWLPRGLANVMVLYF